MKRMISFILFVGILGNLSAQNKNMKQEILKKIELDSFNNRIGLEMGLTIVNLAKKNNQNIAVKIERLNHTIFLFVDDNLPADKHLWLKRKANVTKHFEESSLSVKNDLINGNMTLEKTFALDEKKYLAKGGSIPIFVKNAGMIAIVSVSGLHDEEDHKIIIEALKEKYIE
jgi:uncharacterized protein (UPF0303 family)